MDGLDTQLEILLDTAIGAVLGGLIGLERGFRGKSAGPRTQMLVGGAAALLMSLGALITSEFNEETGTAVAVDPIRTLQAIIIGVSFIGAGTIFTNNREERVEGLTTAAAILLVTGVGVSVALDQYVLAAGVTAFTLLVLLGMRFVEARLGLREDLEPPGE